MDSLLVSRSCIATTSEMRAYSRTARQRDRASFRCFSGMKFAVNEAAPDLVRLADGVEDLGWVVAEVPERYGNTLAESVGQLGEFLGLEVEALPAGNRRSDPSLVGSTVQPFLEPRERDDPGGQCAPWD